MFNNQLGFINENKLYDVIDLLKTVLLIYKLNAICSYYFNKVVRLMRWYFFASAHENSKPEVMFLDVPSRQAGCLAVVCALACISRDAIFLHLVKGFQ